MLMIRPYNAVDHAAQAVCVLTFKISFEIKSKMTERACQNS